MTKPLLAVLDKKTPSHTPIWLMRQAGRYLPEYRATREKAGSFMKLCFNPELAAEVTLQPVRRFGVDGAILFSDILVVPYSLGLALEFVEGEGPQLEMVGNALPVFDPASFFEKSRNIYETVRLTRGSLGPETTMIGFAGSPFTVACYMLGGKGRDEFVTARLRAYQDMDFFRNLLDRVAQATIFYLNEQIKAGAEAVQLFDSWSNLVPAHLFGEWVIAPTKKIVAGVKAVHPHIPVIGFPRGSGQHLEKYVRATGVDAVSLDQTVDMAETQKKLGCAVQGNLDPLLMRGDRGVLLDQAKQLISSMKTPFIFNLGHGLTPDVPPENVGALVKLVQAYGK